MKPVTYLPPTTEHSPRCRVLGVLVAATMFGRGVVHTVAQLPDSIAQIHTRAGQRGRRELRVARLAGAFTDSGSLSCAT